MLCSSREGKKHANTKPASKATWSFCDVFAAEVVCVFGECHVWGFRERLNIGKSLSRGKCSLPSVTSGRAKCSVVRGE